MEGSSAVRAGLPVPEAALLRQQIKIVHVGRPQAPRETAAHVVVLLQNTCIALPLALGAIDLHRPARQQLHGPVHGVSVLAVVREHASALLGLVVCRGRHDATDSICEEDRVWVDLDRPSCPPKLVILEHLLPQLHEDGGVQPRVPLAPDGAVQAGVNHPGGNVFTQLESFVAVDRPLLAGEQALVVRELPTDEILLCAKRKHQGEAKQGVLGHDVTARVGLGAVGGSAVARVGLGVVRGSAVARVERGVVRSSLHVRVGFGAVGGCAWLLRQAHQIPRSNAAGLCKTPA
mmetsp:Transcript_27375/g.78878  ORF Transcript_27375/g.78878 Transcript_27375/m.78878 type:complete len:290 (-) Transcript_27375:250-1119(-)